MVTKNDADVLCAFHQGWVAELDHPGINYWLKSRLLDTTEIGEYAQFWLGATCDGRHDSEHDQGHWTWPHMNQDVQWFDWADVNLTTTTKSVVSLCTSTTTRGSHGPGTTSGTTSAVIRLPTTSVRGSAPLFRYLID